MAQDEELLNKITSSSSPIDLDDQKKPVLDKLGRAYATGRRKTSVSRVWIKYGQPKIVVNGKPVEKYFLRKIYTSILEAPLAKTDNLDKIEIFTTYLRLFLLMVVLLHYCLIGLAISMFIYWMLKLVKKKRH